MELLHILLTIGWLMSILSLRSPKVTCSGMPPLPSASHKGSKHRHLTHARAPCPAAFHRPEPNSSSTTTTNSRVHQPGQIPATQRSLLGSVAATRAPGSALAIGSPQRKESSVELNLLDYGAAGDGETDDTASFLSAWAAACATPSGYVHVPAGYSFLLYPIIISGPCEQGFSFQVDGTIVAPQDPTVWTDTGLTHWLHFNSVSMTVQGPGTFDGRGQTWWANSCKTNPDNPCVSGPTVSATPDRRSGVRMMSRRTIGVVPSQGDGPYLAYISCFAFTSPIIIYVLVLAKHAALVFDTCTGVTMRSVTILNSQQIHLAFLKSSGIFIDGVTITAPGDSPNTDGIHLQNSSSVIIRNTVIGTGDDCISIQTGSFDIQILNAECGPGHGMSVGGLGKNNSEAEVADVLVDAMAFFNATNGVRIKTWQGSSGYARGFTFKNIQMIETKNSIVIDQYYCDSDASGSCPNATSNVVISDTVFQNITGTSTTNPAVSIQCSETVACTAINLTDINLVLTSGLVTTSSCTNAFGSVTGTTAPVSCLQS